MQMAEILDQSQAMDMVYMTTDYSLFKFQEGNRIINPRNYNKLLKSVKEKQLRIPIIVNENMEIIDGQHRFKSWREEGKPIYYIINEGYGLEETKRANIVSATWTTQDFVNTYVAEGKESYIVFKELKATHGVSNNDLLFLFALYQRKTIKNMKDDFVLGGLSLEGEEHVRLFLEKLELFTDFQYGKQTKFVKAFAKIYHLEEYDHAVMEKQYKTHGYKLKRQNNLDDYIAMILNDVYNYAKTKNRIGYDKETHKFYSL